MEVYCPKCKKLFKTETEMLEHYTSEHEEGKIDTKTNERILIGKPNIRLTKNRKMVLIAVPILAVLLLGGCYLNSSINIHNPVKEYAISKNLPSNFIDILTPLGNNGQITYETESLIDQLAMLENYLNNSLVRAQLNSILSDGKVDINESRAFGDLDNDFISNNLEVTTYHTDPTKMDTSGLGLDDFNAVFTYGIDPNNKTAVHEFLAKIPNVVANQWNLTSLSSPRINDNIVAISMRDPLIQYYAKKSEIILDDNFSRIWDKTAKNWLLLVDGNPIWKAYNYDNSTNRLFNQPAYYFTHGRIGQCMESTLSDITILKLMGYNATEVGGRISNHEMGHDWAETCIDGKIYIVDYGQLSPREGFYENSGYVPESNYDPNWYLK